MKFKELQELKIDQLNKMLKSEREKMRALKFSINSRPEKNVRKLREIRKENPLEHEYYCFTDEQFLKTA